MSVSVQEQYGRRHSGSRAEQVYLIRGTQDAVVARDTLLDTAPQTFADGTFVRLDREVEVSEIADLSDGAYIGSVPYVRPDAQLGTPPMQPGQSRESFETAGQTQRIYSSRQTVGAYGQNTDVDDYGGLIGVTDQDVRGVEVPVPVYQWSHTHVFEQETVTDAYKGHLYHLTGCVNNAAFKGFAGGEVLFMGAAGSQRADGAYEINFRFASQPNRLNWTPLPGFSGVDKLGWEYLWVRHSAQVNASQGILVQKPIAVYVEKVFETGDFALLGIGTS